MIGFLFIISALCYNYCEPEYPSTKPSIPDSTLVHVSVLNRHGARSTYHVYPPYSEKDAVWDVCHDSFNFTDNYTPSVARYESQFYTTGGGLADLFWKGNCAAGQLTRKGIEQTKKIGAALRKVYIDDYKFIPNYYDERVVYARSSDVTRVRHTCYNILGELYPNVSVKVDVNAVETMYSNPDFCPYTEQQIEVNKQTEEFKSHMSRNKALYDKLRYMLNATSVPSKWDSFMPFCDNFWSRKCHGVAPLTFNGVSLTDAEVDTLLSLGGWEINFFDSGEVSVYGAGFFLQEIIAAVNRTLSNTGPKFYLYATHDRAISQILHIAQVNDMLWPPYAAHLILELWKPNSGGEIQLRMIYNGGVLVPPMCASSVNGTISWNCFVNYVMKNAKPDVNKCANWGPY